MIEWGDGIFVCEAASRAYFGKSCAGLDIHEAALLAGAIINPREHSPAKPTRRLVRRQQIVLRRMQYRPPAPAAPAPLNESAPAPINESAPAPVNESAPVEPPVIPVPQPFPQPTPSNKSGNGSAPAIPPALPR